MTANHFLTTEGHNPAGGRSPKANDVDYRDTARGQRSRDAKERKLKKGYTT